MRRNYIETKLELVMMDDGEELPMDFTGEKDFDKAVDRMISIVQYMGSLDLGEYRIHKDNKTRHVYVNKVCH